MPPSRTLATIVAANGREIVLDAVGWEHVLAEHPEMRHHQAALLSTVKHPSHVRPDPKSGRERFYRQGVGPSRWVMAVVDFNQSPARIVTAFGLRRART